MYNSVEISVEITIWSLKAECRYQ
uniref:Uncharacterized protein n=1 Tax=Tetranychus urticae TaxID=32264 RepID=T1JTH1_TETUR